MGGGRACCRVAPFRSQAVCAAKAGGSGTTGRLAGPPRSPEQSFDLIAPLVYFPVMFPRINPVPA